MAGWRHGTQKGWNVPAEGLETNTEVLRIENARNTSKSELVQNRLNDGHIDNAYDNNTILTRVLLNLVYFFGEKSNSFLSSIISASLTLRLSVMGIRMLFIDSSNADSFSIRDISSVDLAISQLRIDHNVCEHNRVEANQLISSLACLVFPSRF